jgi:membrane protease YdiL (CAAX protease family)
MTDYSGVQGADPAARLRAVGTSILLTIGGFALTFVVLSVVFSALTDFGIPANNPLIRYPLGTVLQAATFVGLVVVFLRATGREGILHIHVPSLRDVGLMIGGIVALFVVLTVISVLFNTLGVSTAQNQIVELGLQNPTLMLYMIPLSFLAIGVGEEFLFRGAIQGLLRQVYAPIPAILIASVIFAIAHAPSLLGGDGGAKAATIAALTALSLVLGALYEYSDNLLVPIVVHGAYDAITFTQVYLMATS